MANIRTKPEYPLPNPVPTLKSVVAPTPETERFRIMVNQIKQAIRDIHEDLQDHETRITAVEP